MSAPRWLIAALHLSTLWSFTFVQPLFDLLADNGEFFIARGNTGSDILLFAFALVIVPPAILVAAEALAGLAASGLRRGLHLALVAVLAGAFALEVLKGVAPRGGGVLAAAAIAGLAFALAYASVASVRSFLTVLAPAPLVFLVLFLVVSPVSGLLAPDPTVRATNGPPARTPVVLMIFDELPTISLMAHGGRLDAERYPAFARLARESTWYRNATTVSDSTPRAVPAILTGLRPGNRTRLPSSRTFPRSVFTMLGARWEQHVHEPVTRLCPPDICPRGSGGAADKRLRSLIADLSIVSGHLLLPEDMTGSLPPIDRGWADFAGVDRELSRGLGDRRGPERPRGDWWARRMAEAQRGIASVRPMGSRPPLHVIHLVAPHVPWRYFPSGTLYLEPGAAVLPGVIPNEGWGPNPYLVRQALQRHLLQVGFADRLLGEMIGRLRRAGLWERSLVVVVSDHGISFKPRNHRRPVTRRNFADVAGVPLFVKRPGRRTGEVVDRPVQTIDVLPTIARVLGEGAGWRFDGRPLDDPVRPRELAVHNKDEGRWVRMSLGAFLRARDAQLVQQLRLFPPGRASLTRLGPNAHLIGRPASAYPRAPSRGGGTIDRAAAYRRVDPRSGVVPAYVTGRLDRREGAGVPLAVAVDGRIGAVGQSFREGGQTRFSVILPPSALPRGGHVVEVFAVGRGTLRLVAGTGH